eukprot:502814_1
MANTIIGNDNENVAGLEITYAGPKLHFDTDTQICLTGAKVKNANINNKRDLINEWFKPIQILKGDTLDLTGANTSCSWAGCRTYLSVQNAGFVINNYLGSKTSFVMGKFGGIDNEGAVLRENHILQYTVNDAVQQEMLYKNNEDLLLSADYIKMMQSTHNEIVWEIGVLPGPQSSPDYLTNDDVELLYNNEYEVSHNASRLGIRLEPKGKAIKFQWSRCDGGHGGSHPSNLIDNPYAIGSVNFTGDYPVILTVDGPSLGGFVCPITIPSTELWKTGQIKPGDTVRFKLMNLKSVITDKQMNSVNKNINEFNINETNNDYDKYQQNMLEPVLYNIDEDLLKNQPKVQYRMAGDRYLLIDYGQDEIDLNLRVRVHKLEQILSDKKLNGIIDTIPGVKTLLIEYEPLQISLKYLLNMLVDLESSIICDVMNLNKNQIILPSRIIHLPFVFNCEWSNDAIQRYMNEVRGAAAYLPSNTQFICNNNGLNGGIQELEQMIYDTSFMVLGLGDVYLGAPCALPIDPRHRLNVPKYNPSRNYTPEGTVGIGGKFMCIYPMESPGGYQLIGRTLQIFSKNDPNNKPWLLNMFDRVRFYPVTNHQLTQQRELNKNGRFEFDIKQEEFNLNEYNLMINEENMKIQVSEFRENQKIYQLKQLKLDKYLSERGDIACRDILCFHAQIMVNGPKYGTSLFLHIKKNFANDEIVIDDAIYTKTLCEFNMTLYNTVYSVMLHEIIEKEQEENKFDVVYVVNGKEFIINDIVFNPANINYVDLTNWTKRDRRICQLSHEELLEIKVLFNFFDKDRNGTIDAKEIMSVMNIFRLHLTLKEATNIISNFDKNGDGVIDFHEFVLMMDSGKLLNSEKLEISNELKTYDPAVKSIQSDVELIASDNIESIRCDLPAKVVKIYVNVGDVVNVGDHIGTLSAMKMAVEICSNVKGKVIYVNNQDILKPNDVIVHIAK